MHLATYCQAFQIPLDDHSMKSATGLVMEHLNPMVPARKAEQPGSVLGPVFNPNSSYFEKKYGPKWHSLFGQLFEDDRKAAPALQTKLWQTCLPACRSVR